MIGQGPAVIEAGTGPGLFGLFSFHDCIDAMEFFNCCVLSNYIEIRDGV